MMGDLVDRPYGKQEHEQEHEHEHGRGRREPVARNLSRHESQMAIDFNKPLSISRRGSADELEGHLPGDDYED